MSRASSKGICNRESKMGKKKSVRGESGNEPKNEPVLITSDRDSTETIDLNSLFTRDVTNSGSFGITGLRKTSFARLLESLPMPVLLIDGSRRIAFVNEYWRRFGPDYDAIQGRDFSSLLADPRLAHETNLLIDKVFSERRTQSQEGVLRTDSGLISARMSLRSIRLANERLVLVLVEDLTLERKQLALQEQHARQLQEARDQLEVRVHERTAELSAKNEQLLSEIARREKIESQLRSSEERFRAVLESAEDWIFVKDARLRYTHINPAMLKLLRLSASRAIGKKDEDLFPPEEAKRMTAVEQRVLRGQTVELEHTFAFGSSLVVGSFVRVPLTDATGTITGLCAIGRDITERKQRERELESNGVPESDNHSRSPVMRHTMKRLLSAAKTDSTCLFLGESGSGKDHLARYLHEHSLRSSGPYISINCAALPPDLVESELFGHEAGAFTGSIRRKRGLLEQAEGGTLLLNEIGELPLRMQAKLLAFLDSHSFTRVGGEKSIFVDARILAATNRDLDSEIRRGGFRADLFYRLNVMTIRVPPLRERKEDLSDLVEILLESLCRRIGFRSVPVPEPGALAAIAAYDWPGNVRELKNVLERALILSDGSSITQARLGLKSGIQPDPAESGISFTVALARGQSMHEALKEAKRLMIVESLEQAEGKIKDAARILGVSRDSFNHHVRSLGISIQR
jgi:PAS domain S-box-containing protein